MNPARLGWSGPAAALLFLTALVGFAAMRDDGYTHGTKAVSELGAIGAPNALLFNVLGFIVPGLLVMVLGWALQLAVAPERKPIGPALLICSGLFFALAGVLPVDMDDLGAMSSLGHVLAVMGSGFAFAGSVFFLGARMRRDPAWRGFGLITPWFVLFLLVNIGWQAVWTAAQTVSPGWGQRIGFFGYFLWITLAGLKLLSTRAEAPGRSS